MIEKKKTKDPADQGMMIPKEQLPIPKEIAAIGAVEFLSYVDQWHYGDIETRGFWDMVETIDDVHCLCTITEGGKVILWHDYPEYDNAVVYDEDDHGMIRIPPRCGSLLQGFKYWYSIGKAGGKLSVHNCSTFDKPIVEKVMPKCIIPVECWVDSFNQSKVQWYDRPGVKGAKSPHGLQAYGIKNGVNKPPITDFTVFNEYILHRVIEDCKIQKLTQLFLNDEADYILAECGISFKNAIFQENEYARGCAAQELRGVLVDQALMRRSVVEWDAKCDVIAQEVEPTLLPTVHPNGSKISRSTMMTAIGLDAINEAFGKNWGNIPPDRMIQVKKKGKKEIVPLKDYYKPSVNFHKIEKVKTYKGSGMMSDGFAESPEFIQKKQWTAWRNENYPNSKPNEWDVESSEVTTRVLNKNTCDYFGVDPGDLHIIVGPHTKVKFKASHMTQHEQVKGKLIRIMRVLGITEVEEWNLKKDGITGQIERAEEDMVVSYPKKGATEEFQLHYHIPRGEAIVTSPKFGEHDYKKLPDGLGKKIAEYNTTAHRRRFFENPKDPDHKGLLAYVRPDGRLPCGVNNFGTSTGRASHRRWVNAPGEKSMYGDVIRSSLIAPKGRKLVGADMKSAQMSIAAFYAKNSSYYESVASGQEVVKGEDGKEVYVGMSSHCVNARNFGLVSEQEFKDAVEFQNELLLHTISLRRGASKAPSFATLFGAAGKKIGFLLDCGEDEGTRKRDRFLSEMGLSDVINSLKADKEYRKKGRGWYIPLPFGWSTYCNSDHKSINYLIQGCEGACQKVAVNWFERRLVELAAAGTPLDGFKVLDYHDEFLCEASAEDANAIGQLMCDAYKYASDECYNYYMENPELFPNSGGPAFAFNLDGGFKVGDTYLATH